MATESTQTPEEVEVRTLYAILLNSWNKRNATDFAALFEENGNQIGFDGSQVNGRVEIESHLSGIFADHMTSAYIGNVREVRFLSPAVAILRAVVGMVPHGKTDINPATNAIQSLVAVKRNGQWRIALFQNTPAQFHGSPDLVEQLTEELRKLL